MRNSAGLAEIGYYDGADTGASGLRPYRAEDSSREWLLDYHFPRGIVPLAHDLVAEAMTESSARAAAAVATLTSSGLECRTVGTHVYTGARPTKEHFAQPEPEAARAAAKHYAASFRTEWARHRTTIEAALVPLEAIDIEAASAKRLASFYRDALHAFSLGWTIHFEVMYQLLLVHDEFLSTCTELGVDGESISRATEVPSSRINVTNHRLRRLADAARDTLKPVFKVRTGSDLLEVLTQTDEGSAWLVEFNEFLVEFGNRSDSVIDVDEPSWREDPTLALAMIEAMLAPTSTEPRAHAGPPSTIPASVAASLTPVARRRFREAYGRLRRANFAWWNEEHNFYIDLRAHLPVRRVGMAVGPRFLGSSRSGLMLFGNELLALCRGDADPASLRALTESRALTHRVWSTRRRELPTRIGSHESHDPVVDQLFGLHRIDDQPTPTLASTDLVHLRGIAVVSGQALGRAQVVRAMSDAADLGTDDVMVCEGTTPTWLSAFSHIAACVCEFGGPLSHAAIASRETNTVCVVGVRGATSLIHDGDLLEVDGATGEVKVIARNKVLSPP